MRKIPKCHMPPFDKTENLAKRATAGFRHRKNYVVPVPVTDYNPQGMKTNPPKTMDDIPTHARWVASWWSRALAQLTIQGDAKLESLNMSDLLTQFLNANKVIMENSNRVGWQVDNEKWSEAVDCVRRMDADFSLKEHFSKISDSEISDAKTRVENKPKAQGTTRKDKSDKAQSTLPSEVLQAIKAYAVAASSSSGKGGKGGRSDYRGKGGKGDYWPKGGKGGYGRDTKGKGRDKGVKREAAREQRKR